jgi:hypothetical protein
MLGLSLVSVTHPPPGAGSIGMGRETATGSTTHRASRLPISFHSKSCGFPSKKKPSSPLMSDPR